MNALVTILIIITTVIVTYLTHKLLHELGHLLFFRIFKLEFTRLQLGFWEVFRENAAEKYRLRKNANFKFSCGCKNLTNISNPKIVITLLAGGFANLVFSAATIFIFFWTENGHLKIMAGFQFLWSLSDFIANVLYPYSTDRKLIRQLLANERE